MWEVKKRFINDGYHDYPDCNEPINEQETDYYRMMCSKFDNHINIEVGLLKREGFKLTINGRFVKTIYRCLEEAKLEAEQVVYNEISNFVCDLEVFREKLVKQIQGYK